MAHIDLGGAKAAGATSPRWLHGAYRARGWLDLVIRSSAIALFSTAVLVTLVATLARTVPALPDLTWADEFTRYAIIVSIFLVVPLGLRRGTQITVGLVLEAAPRPVFRALTVLNQVMLLSFSAVVAFYGYKVAQLNAAQRSPLLDIPLRDLYLVVSLSGVLLMLEAVTRIAEAFAGTAPRPSETEAMTSAGE